MSAADENEANILESYHSALASLHSLVGSWEHLWDKHKALRKSFRELEDENERLEQELVAVRGKLEAENLQLVERAQNLADELSGEDR